MVAKGETFFLKNKQGDLEFTLLAEGMRKLALVWLLIQNGTLLSGSVLFWDEPEANLNPALMGDVVEVILELQRLDVQVFLSTHNYVLLKEFDLRKKKAMPFATSRCTGMPMQQWSPTPVTAIWALPQCHCQHLQPPVRPRATT